MAQQRPACEQWNSVWVVSGGTLWRWWWRWGAEPLIMSWQDNNVPCCLFFFFFNFSGGTVRSGRSGQCEAGDVVFVWLWKMCAVGPMNIFDARYLFFFFFFCLIIPYKYYQKCCYACFCERGRASVRFHLCMNSNHSAGGGRSGWTGAFTKQEKERDADVMWCEATGVMRNLSEGPVESQCGEGEKQVARSRFMEADSVCFNNLGYHCSVPLRSPW